MHADPATWIPLTGRGDEFPSRPRIARASSRRRSRPARPRRVRSRLGEPAEGSIFVYQTFGLADLFAVSLTYIVRRRRARRRRMDAAPVGGPFSLAT
jgi:hypothetical protein